MTDRDGKRTELSAQYAGLLGQFQQEQRDLLNALRDDTVGAREFEQICDRQTVRLQELKRIKIVLMSKRPPAGSVPSSKPARPPWPY